MALENLSEPVIDELLKLDNQLCFPLYACSKEVVRRYTPYLDEIGLTYTQYLVMMALWEHDNLSVSQLGQLIYLDSGTLTPLLKKLEAKGLVSRTRDAHDERQVNIACTADGQALKVQAASIPLGMGQCVGLNADEAEQLVGLLRKVIGNVRAS